MGIILLIHCAFERFSSVREAKLKHNCDNLYEFCQTPHTCL